jgi:hypothetical protein
MGQCPDGSSHSSVYSSLLGDAKSEIYFSYAIVINVMWVSNILPLTPILVITCMTHKFTERVTKFKNLSLPEMFDRVFILISVCTFFGNIFLK